MPVRTIFAPWLNFENLVNYPIIANWPIRWASEKKFPQGRVALATWGTISAPQIVILLIIFENGKKSLRWNKNGRNMLSELQLRFIGLVFRKREIVESSGYKWNGYTSILVITLLSYFWRNLMVWRAPLPGVHWTSVSWPLNTLVWQEVLTPWQRSGRRRPWYPAKESRF